MTDAPKNRPIATRVHEAFRLPSKMPVEKVSSLIMKTIVGIAIAVVGVAIVAVALDGYRTTKEVSIPLLCIGIAVVFVGGNIASNQFLARSLLSFREPVHVARTLWKGGGAPAAEPTTDATDEAQS